MKPKPLLSGKSGLYTVRPMKDSEVIELDSKVFPTSQPPPSYPVQAETDTPKSESKSICRENYKLTLYFLSE